jgi:hypothetical protein
MPSDPRRCRKTSALNRGGWLLSALLLSASPSCGGTAANAPAESPESAPATAPQSGVAADESSEPSSVEEAEAALARAQQELDSALGPLAFAQPPPAQAPAPARAQEGAGAPGDADKDAGRKRSTKQEEAAASAAPEAESKSDGNCDLACRAFGSLSGVPPRRRRGRALRAGAQGAVRRRSASEDLQLSAALTRCKPAVA